MTPLATGRSRHVDVTIVGRIDYSAGTFDTASGTWSPESWGQVFGSGWFAGAGVSGGESAVSSDGKSIQFAWGAGWSLSLDTITGFRNYALASDGSQGSFPTVTSITGTATGTASFDLIEYEDGGAPYELSGPVTRTLDASLSITFSTTQAHDTSIPPDGIIDSYSILFTDTVSFSGHVDGTMLAGQVPDYLIFHRLFAINADSLGNISVSCDGIGYSETIIAPTIDSGCTIGGGVLTPTLHVPLGGGRGIVPSETVIIEAEPDWAIQATLQARYYGGTAFSGAEVELRLNADGTGILDSAATDASGVAVLTYPSGGYYGPASLGWYSVTWTPPIDNGESLSGNRSSVYVNEAWADSYGTDGGRMAGLFGPNTFSRVVGLYALPSFNAGNLAIASSHAFGMFGSVTGWSVLGFGTLTLDSGVWKWAGDGSSNFGAVAGDGKFLPLAYRYYTLRLKCDTAGASIRITARMFRTTDRRFGDLFATATWIITPATTDYEDHEIDWLFPDELEDQVLSLAPPPISQRYPFHPFFCQSHYQATGQGYILGFIFPPNVTVHVESLTGHQRSDGTRTAMTLHAPLPNWTDGQPETAMKPPIGMGGEDTWGWLQVNAALGMAFTPSSSATVQDAVTNLQGLYDTAARDTGLTITDAAATYAARNTWGPETWLVADGVTLPRGPADAASTDIVGMRRLGDTYGYYGMGDCVGGAYGATLIYAGDFWLDGEVTVLAWKPRASAAGVTLELIDNDTGSVLDTAVSDDDGLWAVSSKYGVREPFSSAPAADQSLGAHAQFTDHGFAAPDYTTEGKLLNSYWLLGLGRFRERATGIINYSPQQQFQYNYTLFTPDRLDVEVFTGQAHHYDIPIGSNSRNPDNVHDQLGRFHRASIDDLGAGDTLTYRRMDFNSPEGGGWAVETDLGPDVSDPAIAIVGQDLALRASITYTRDDGIYLRESDDDGDTFEPEVLVIPNGTRSEQFPKIPSPTGERFVAALVPGTPNLIQAVYQGPASGTWSDVFTFQDSAAANLEWEADSFAVSWNFEPGTPFVRWVLTGVISGETEVSEWYCDAEPDFDSPAMLWERVV